MNCNECNLVYKKSLRAGICDDCNQEEVRELSMVLDAKKAAGVVCKKDGKCGLCLSKKPQVEKKYSIYSYTDDDIKNGIEFLKNMEFKKELK